MLGEEILIEIDETLERLIHNADTMSQVKKTTLAGHEIEAFQKTQESLLEHLLHMDELFALQQKPSLPPTRTFKIQERLLRLKKDLTRTEKSKKSLRSWQKIGK